MRAMQIELDAIKVEKQSVADRDRSCSVAITNDPSDSDVKVGVRSGC